MCGIMHIKRNDGHSPIKPLLARYEQQKGRGTDGFGFVAVKDGYVIGYERATTEAEIKEKISKYAHATEFLFHHRFPTSTDNLEETAHPIFVSNKMLKHDYYLIHNGHISNSKDLKVEHEALGFVYNTEVEILSGYNVRGKHKKKKHHFHVTKTEFNDSESLAIEFALYNDGIKDVLDTYGGAAFIAYEVEKGTGKIIALHYGRNSNPIIAFRAHGMFILSSQSTDKDSAEIENYKQITIPYVDGKQSSPTVKPMSLLLSNYTLGHSKIDRSNLQYNHEYPSYSKTNVGYNVDDRGLAEDFDDNDDDYGVLLLPGATHMPQKPIPVSVDKDKVIYNVCKKTGVRADYCTCSTHLHKDIPSPYHTTKTTEHYCSVCDGKMLGAMYLNPRNREWVHFDCLPDGVPIVESVDKDNKGRDYSGDYNKEFEQLTARITNYESMIEQLENMIDAMDDGASDEWLKKSIQLESFQEKLDSAQDDLAQLVKFMDGSLF